MIDKLSKLPLAAQPGTDWRYGPSVDIQGYLVEKLSGQTLDVFLQTKIFEPLGMTDTGFWVEPSKAAQRGGPRWRSNQSIVSRNASLSGRL